MPAHYAVRRERAAPRYTIRRREIAAPRERQVAPAFVERVQAPRHIVNVREQRSPFIQYVRAPRAERRTVYVRREIAPAVAYHPTYLTGRVVRVRRNYVVLRPPVGEAITVACACYRHYRHYRTGSYATVPAMYRNGTYVAYPYHAPSNVYYAASPYYGSWDNDGDENDNDDGYYNSAPYYYNYGQPYYGNGGYYNNVPYYGQSPYYDQSPYDNCLWSDNDGDEGPYCAQQSGYYTGYPYNASPYNGYPYSAGYPYDTGYPNNGYPYGTAYPYGNDPYGSTYPYGGSPYGMYSGYGYGTPYAPQQVQGIVIAKTGSIIMLLGANGLKPIMVDAGPALQNGLSANGPIAAGQVVDAYGYYSGDTFIATMLV
jgi:hypothetical protein